MDHDLANERILGACLLVLFSKLSKFAVQIVLSIIFALKAD